MYSQVVWYYPHLGEYTLVPKNCLAPEVPHTMLNGKPCCGSAVAMDLLISRQRSMEDLWFSFGGRADYDS